MFDKLKNAWQLKRALIMVWQSGPYWTILSMVCIVIQGFLPLVSLYLLKLVIDAVTAGVGNSSGDFQFKTILLYIALLGLVSLIGVLAQSGSTLVREAQAQIMTDHMHSILHAKSVAVDLMYYENAEYYDNLHRAQQEAPFRPTRIVYGLVQAGQSGLSLLAMAGLLFSFHWIVASILFLAAMPSLFVRIQYAGKFYRWNRKRTPADRQSYYFHWLLTMDQMAKEIRLFNLGNLFRERYRELRKELRKERIDLVSRRALADFITQASATLAIFGSLAFIAYRAVLGMISLGDLVMYYQAFQRGQGYLKELLRALADLYEDNLFLTNLYEFLDLEPSIADRPNARPFPRPMTSSLACKDLCFTYPNGTRPVLQGIDLTIKPGQVIALVGENGSGKTTLVKLLCRLYDPTRGAIEIDGVDLREYTVDSVRREMSVIFQDYAKYHLTARENIWFGNIELDDHADEIEAAARFSGAHDPIMTLPKGYDTILGKWFEQGEEISIGEWQKVALARAILRSAQIIILDEPTSAMDARTEYAIFKTFREMVRGKTAILISHRFSTVRGADWIYVLHNGQILESGPHHELMQLDGMYAQLFEAQASNYR
ncbi:ABC transporter ATP-binding protein [bacterium]|nr:ABC transporter ATP-binding protein [bacterium]